MKKTDLCDLHTHSTASDGTYTPAELILAAEETGLYAIALTDHNVVKGLPEFYRAAEGKRVRAIGGVEFSTDYGEKELHIVALFVKEEYYSAIQALVSKMVESKKACNLELAKRLNDAGYTVDYPRMYEENDGHINRTHFARELMARGYVNSIEEAFDTVLSKDGSFYTQPKRLDSLEVISFIKSIGAVSVLAHPFLNLTEEELRRFLPKAKEAGLDAMETEYSTYDEPTHALANEIAREFNLLQSGGSDFHGISKPDISLGCGRGALNVPKEIFLKLEEASRKR